MKRLLLILGLVAALAIGALLSPLQNPIVLAQTNTFCASNLACTLTAIWTFNAQSIFNGVVNFTADTDVQGKLFLSAGNAWIDVKAPPYSAKCDGSTDDTTAIQNALTALTAQTGGGTLFVPAGASPCLVSTLNMDGFINVTVLLGGFGKSSEGGNNSQANIRFTGTCSAAACLSMRSTGDIHWWGGTLSFPNAVTTGACTNSYSSVTICPMIDLGHSALATDSVRIGFHNTALVGPGANSNGPIVMDPQTDIVTFDHVLFTGASVFISGPVNNSAGFTDKTIVYACNPYLPGTAAFQNASINWTFQDNIYTSTSASVPFLQYVNSMTQQQNITFQGNEFLTGATGTISLISLPVPPAANYGNLTYTGNLAVSTNPNLTVLNLGNNQRAHIAGNLFTGMGTVLTVGTGVNLDIGTNQYNGITTFINGTPAGGLFIDTNASTNIAANQALNLVCGNQPTLPVGDASMWCETTTKTLRVALNGDSGGAGTIVPRSGDKNTFTSVNAFPGNTAALTADWTCGTGGTVSTCAAATIIGSGGGVPLTFTLPSVAQAYTLECDGVVGQATAATLNQWNLLTATNGATNVTADYAMATAATAAAYGAVTDQASTTTTFQITPSWTLGGTGTKMPFHIWAKIEGASASGTVVSLQLLAPTPADVVTIFRGAACRVF